MPKLTADQEYMVEYFANGDCHDLDMQGRRCPFHDTYTCDVKYVHKPCRETLIQSFLDLNAAHEAPISDFQRLRTEVKAQAIEIAIARSSIGVFLELDREDPSDPTSWVDPLGVMVAKLIRKTSYLELETTKRTGESL